MKLALINQNTVTPPPTKTEILDAMVRRAEVLFKKELEDHKKKLEAAEIKARAGIMKLLSKGVGHLLNRDAYFGYLHYLEKEGRFDLNLEIKLSEKENGLKQDLITLYKLRNSRPCFDEKACRRELRDKLNQKSPSAARVESLLSNPEAVKAMDAFIKE